MRTATISFFKAHISGLLRAVRGGEEVIVLDRDIPVARVTRVAAQEAALVSSAPSSPIPFRKLSITVAVDPVETLLRDRVDR